MRAAGFFCDFVQRRPVGFGEGGGNRTVRFEDSLDETGSLRARIIDAAVRNEAAQASSSTEQARVLS